MGSNASTAGRIGLAAATGGNSELINAGMKFLGGDGGGGGPIDMSGMPQAPKFQSLRANTGPNAGLFENQNLRLNAGPDVNLNTQGLEEIRKRALGQGPSAWAQLQMQQNAAGAAGQRSAAAANAAASQAQARGQLAQHGGLMGGASERLAQNAGNQLMQQRQGIGAGLQNQNLQTQLQDEQQKTQLLQGLPGMEVQATQPQFQNRAMNMQTQQYNIGNALQDKYAQDQAAQLQYQQQMQAWAAQKQAQAIQNAGGGKKGGGGGGGGGIVGGAQKALGGLFG